MFNIIHTGNLQVIRAMGRSDITLIMEIVKKSSYAVVILLFVLFSTRPEMLAVASIVNTLIATVINTVPNVKLIGYKVKYQLYDILPNLITSTIMCVCVLLIGRLELNVYLLLFIQVVSGVVIYLALNVLIRNPNLKLAINMVKGFLKHKNV